MIAKAMVIPNFPIIAIAVRHAPGADKRKHETYALLRAREGFEYVCIEYKPPMYKQKSTVHAFNYSLWFKPCTYI